MHKSCEPMHRLWLVMLLCEYVSDFPEAVSKSGYSGIGSRHALGAEGIARYIYFQHSPSETCNEFKVSKWKLCNFIGVDTLCSLLFVFTPWTDLFASSKVIARIPAVLSASMRMQVPLSSRSISCTVVALPCRSAADRELLHSRSILGERSATRIKQEGVQHGSLFLEHSGTSWLLTERHMLYVSIEESGAATSFETNSHHCEYVVWRTAHEER
eukprot:1539527-Amphidinium_carterae.1